MQRAEWHHFYDIIWKMHSVNLIMRKGKDKPKVKNILQNNWTVIFKKYHS